MQLFSWKVKLLIIVLLIFLNQATFADPPIHQKAVQSILETQIGTREANTLKNKLRESLKITRHLPVPAPPPESVRHVFATPVDYTAILSKLGTLQSAIRLIEPARILEQQLLSFTDEYPQETKFCYFEDLPVPETLEELVHQIESYALLSRAYYSEALTQNQKSELEQNWSVVSTMLMKSPSGSNFSEMETLTTSKFLTQLSQIKLDSALCASLVWGQLVRQKWIDRLHQLMKDHPRANSPVILRKTTPLGEIILSGAAATTIESDNLLLAADLGGNDIYSINTLQRFSGIPQLIIDFAGDDTYVTTQPGGFASGIGKAEYLIDFEGDDQYMTTDQSLGIGILGVGMLIDVEGNDRYSSGSMAQGMALYGIGLLVDQSGDDHYLLQTMGQGLGMTSGFGQLIDAGGHDQYHSNSNLPTSYGTAGIKDSWVQGVGVGLRDISTGGVGVLIDLAGRDSYDAMSFAQGGGYYYGLGVFMDLGEANDSYLGARYNFGWGAHAGVGYFKEYGGDDLYHTRQIVAAGLAWDHSLAFFHDLSGDDVYELGDFSLGAAAHYSIATFLDSGGSDIYHNVNPADSKKGLVNLSIFIDLGVEEDNFGQLLTRPGCTTVDPFGYVLLLLSPDELSLNDCRP